MKILVTGGTGFIGKYVLEYLAATDHTVIVTTSKTDFPPATDRLRHRKLNMDKISDEVNYFDELDQPDLLIHLAWQGLPNYKSLFHFEENLPSHYRFIKNMVSNGLKDVTITGTCFEYGLKEGELSEDLPADPQNPYAIAKDSLRRFVTELNKQKQFSFKWLRLFYTYGNGQNPNSLLSQLEKAVENDDDSFNMSGGEQLRDYLPVETLAEYIVKVALQDKVTGIVNCCNGSAIMVKDFVENYLQKSGRSIKLKLGYYPYSDLEPMAFWGDNKKLKSILNNE